MVGKQNIDWKALATELGRTTYTDRGWTEQGGSLAACEALELILGPQALRSSVDYYISRQPGFELVRSVLWLLHSPSAMERCHEIFLTTEDIEDRRAAIELLRVVADKRALEWVPDYLADPDAEIQVWGIGVVDQLLMSGAEFEDCLAILDAAETHANGDVREKAQWIREHLGPES
jgi:hypothetical protein